MATGPDGAGVPKMVNSRQPAASAATINNTPSHFIVFILNSSCQLLMSHH
jgi:hypothetical protein